MKFITLSVISAIVVLAGPIGKSNKGLGKRQTSAKQQPPPQQVPLRRVRAGASPRKLGAESSSQAPEVPRLLYQQPLLGGLLGVPRDLISNFVAGGGPVSSLAQLTGAGYAGAPAQLMQNHFGGFVDRTRNVADSSLDTVEQIAQGVAQRSRSVLDRATSRAADFVDHSVALGSNSLGAGIDAARGLQEEAKRIAAQAAGAAHGAVKAGELAFAGAFDRLASAVNHAVPTQETLMAQEAQGGILTNPLGTLMSLASSGV